MSTRSNTNRASTTSSKTGGVSKNGQGLENKKKSTPNQRVAPLLPSNSQGTVRVQSGYSQGTVRVTVRLGKSWDFGIC